MTAMTGKRDVLLPVAESRSRTYWLAAGFFLTAPARDVIDGLKMQLGELQASADAKVPQAAMDLAGSLDGVDLERLEVEYTRLFCGIQDGYGPPPPYESLYREGRLMGDSTQDVIGMYGAAGFGMIEQTVSPQDHIGAELKFMSMLCYEEAGALEQGDEAAVRRLWAHQEAFLDRHLAAWVPDYCRRIEAESREPFYAAAAALTEKILAADRSLLAEYVGERGFRPADVGYSAASS